MDLAALYKGDIYLCHYKRKQKSPADGGPAPQASLSSTKILRHFQWPRTSEIWAENADVQQTHGVPPRAKQIHVQLTLLSCFNRFSGILALKGTRPAGWGCHDQSTPCDQTAVQWQIKRRDSAGAILPANASPLTASHTEAGLNLQGQAHVSGRCATTGAALQQAMQPPTMMTACYGSRHCSHHASPRRGSTRRALCCPEAVAVVCRDGGPRGQDSLSAQAAPGTAHGPTGF